MYRNRIILAILGALALLGIVVVPAISAAWPSFVAPAAAPLAGPQASAYSGPQSTWSAYQPVEGLEPAPAAPIPTAPVIGAGSAYNGGSYGTVQPAAPAQPSCQSADLLAGAALSELTARIDDYARHCPSSAMQPAAQAQPNCNCIELPAGVDMGKVANLMNDHVRRCS